MSLLHSPRAYIHYQTKRLCHHLNVEHTSSYLDAKRDPKHRIEFGAEAEWLLVHQELIVNSAVISDEDVRDWQVDAARVLFGQKPRKSPRRR